MDEKPFIAFIYLILSMGKISKTFAIFLTLIIAMSCLTLLLVKSVSAQKNPNPSVSILYPTDNTVFNVSIGGIYFQLLYQTNDTLSWVGYSINGGANVTCTGNVTDNTAYIKNGYQFDFEHPTLTLYANDTAGEWAIPQIVTYTVYFYPDTTSAPSSIPTSASSSSTPSSTQTASPTATQSPSVPELSWLVSVPLLLFTIAVIIRHRKTANLGK
jgi:hypothetical protein